MKMTVSGLRVGYVPYSEDLQHPADRRRLNIVSGTNEIVIETKQLTNIDVLVLSNACNFQKYIKEFDCPIIIDLVDAYLAEQPRLIKDFFRNFVRFLNGTSSLRFLRYTSHIKYACSKADAVIVATLEQSVFVKNLNNNVHIIIDDQSEMLNSGQSATLESSEVARRYLFWEGLGYTLKHFESIATELENFLLENNFYLKVLTNPKFPRWGGFIGSVDSEKVIQKIFPRAWRNVEIIAWTTEETKKAARESLIGIIPIQKLDKFAMFKPENKLISMWAMGIPVICTPTPAYSRVAKCIDAKNMLCSENWNSQLKLLARDLNAREELIYKGKNYYNTFCTKQILQKSWINAISSVLEE
jgi:hypothetical protein